MFQHTVNTSILLFQQDLFQQLVGAGVRSVRVGSVAGVRPLPTWSTHGNIISMVYYAIKLEVGGLTPTLQEN